MARASRKATAHRSAQSNPSAAFGLAVFGTAIAGAFAYWRRNERAEFRSWFEGSDYTPAAQERLTSEFVPWFGFSLAETSWYALKAREGDQAISRAKDKGMQTAIIAVKEIDSEGRGAVNVLPDTASGVAAAARSAAATARSWLPFGEPDFAEASFENDPNYIGSMELGEPEYLQYDLPTAVRKGGWRKGE